MSRFWRVRKVCFVGFGSFGMNSEAHSENPLKRVRGRVCRLWGDRISWKHQFFDPLVNLQSVYRLASIGLVGNSMLAIFSTNSFEDTYRLASIGLVGNITPSGARPFSLKAYRLASIGLVGNSYFITAIFPYASPTAYRLASIGLVGNRDCSPRSSE